MDQWKDEHGDRDREGRMDQERPTPESWSPGQDTPSELPDSIDDDGEADQENFPD